MRASRRSDDDERQCKPISLPCVTQSPILESFQKKRCATSWPETTCQHGHPPKRHEAIRMRLRGGWRHDGWGDWQYRSKCSARWPVRIASFEPLNYLALEAALWFVEAPGPLIPVRHKWRCGVGESQAPRSPPWTCSVPRQNWPAENFTIFSTTPASHCGHQQISLIPAHSQSHHVRRREEYPCGCFCAANKAVGHAQEWYSRLPQTGPPAPTDILPGKQWHAPKKAFRPAAGHKSYEKRTKDRAALAQMKAKEKEMKDEKEQERKVWSIKSRLEFD